MNTRAALATAAILASPSPLPAPTTPEPEPAPTAPAATTRGGPAVPAARGGHAQVVEPRRPVPLGRYLAAKRGWVGREWVCLYRLWNRESGWRVLAFNRSSGATGIPQALPGRKMARYGRAWRTSARVQILWGLDYITRRYGTPCRALAHSDRTNWY